MATTESQGQKPSRVGGQFGSNMGRKLACSGGLPKRVDVVETVAILRQQTGVTYGHAGPTTAEAEAPQGGHVIREFE